MKKPFYKKIWFWLIIIIVLGGAGAAGTNKKDKDDIVSVERPEKTELGTETQKSSSASEASTQKNNEPTINEMTLFDADGVKCIAKGIKNDKIWGYGIDVEIENTTDKNIIIQCDATIVNDYMIFDIFSCDVAAGKKAKDTIKLSSNELNAAGIDNIGKVEIYFKILDPDTFSTIKKLDPVTIKTSSFSDMDTTADIGGKTLYDENGIKIVGRYVDNNSFWGAGICLYIENNTDKNLIITAEDVSVNGYMIDGHLYCDIYAGKKAVDDIAFMASKLEENGITSVDDVELCFEFMDDDYNIEKTDVIKFSTK